MKTQNNIMNKKNKEKSKIETSIFINNKYFQTKWNRIKKIKLNYKMTKKKSQKEIYKNYVSKSKKC